MAGHTIKEAKGAPAFRLKYKGIFDYNKIATFIIEWMKNRHFDLNEAIHKHKMSCPHGFEIERTIEGERKISDFYKYKVTAEIHMWDAFEVDAVKDGKKVKLWNARVEIALGFEVVCDYSGKYETSEFMEKLRNFYCEYIIKKEIIIRHADSLYYKLLSLHTALKKMLDMETATVFR
ncbi:MAG: hypothetical protein V1729_04870 [Candidatus Woesearchaeota archaeon]